MRILAVVILSFCLFSFCQKENQRPNIIYILADDLGYGELGIYGQKIIETPNIDALAKDGMKFTQHYAGAPVCAPSRCVLLTGKHLGHANIRGNDEWNERGDVWSLKAMDENPSLEGQRPMPDSIITVAEILKNAGYKTSLFGKWGLGAPFSESTPNKQGFDYFFGYNCQRQAHTLFPTHLWRNEEKYPLKNKFLDLHQSLDKSLDPNDPKSYASFELTDYAPEVMHREAIRYLEKQQKDEPFFMFYASPLPHVPLQAPAKWVKYYQQKIGPEEPYTGGKSNIYYPNRTPKATYAAMISYLDEQVGDIVKTLKQKGQYENTLIIFTSDNGPSYAGGAKPEFFNSAGPFQEQHGRGKGFVYEGGIRVPMIATWPKTIKKGFESNHISSFYDFMSTIGDLLQIKTPENDGISYLPTLTQKKQKKHDYLYWEFPETGGQQAIRMGKWKAIRTELHKGIVKTQLYDLSKDIREEHDISASFPEIVKTAEITFKENHVQAANKRFRIRSLGDEM
ncbi:arylsulfatase [Lacihabitans soyangensis]|uniref:N-acetylgalactosamine-6-sulfatase n=1 Tax=Lacihabitans soyangensis TaxID=869394 RepID=A0AAE3H4L0_9BACT|nr:arylsulfatase [Lacihabitans soyangensis]MCP9762825.1 N-acetylgalactosamine-6-sulfatase [Lacihabitans soyangensis]